MKQILTPIAAIHERRSALAAHRTTHISQYQTLIDIAQHWPTLQAWATERAYDLMRAIAVLDEVITRFDAQIAGCDSGQV